MLPGVRWHNAEVPITRSLVASPPRTDFHGDEEIRDMEGSGRRDENAADNDGLRMVANEGRPTLAGVSAWIAALQILACMPCLQ